LKYKKPASGTTRVPVFFVFAAEAQGLQNFYPQMNADKQGYLLVILTTPCAVATIAYM
jgi:hypothetical protein